MSDESWPVGAWAEPHASSMPDIEPSIMAELRELRIRQVAVQGSVVASTDGMIIAHDLAETNAYGVEPETLAALAAANLGLSQRIADTASHGELRATVISGAFGHVATYAAGDYALLTVLAREEARVDALHVEAHRIAGRVAALVDSAPPEPAWGTDLQTDR